MRILSIQSQVVYGHVGNSAIAFPLACLGHELIAVPTAILSNHAGYPDTGGRALTPEEVADLLAGLARRGILPGCDLVLSGYLGSAATVPVVADAVARVRAANPPARYACDPVLGDRDTGLYVDADLPGAFADALIPVADILTPNLFELETLGGLPEGSLDGADPKAIADAAGRCRARMRDGACILVTSAVHNGLADDAEAMLAVDANGTWLIEMPRLSFTTQPHGVGDLVAALFAADLADSGDPAAALERAAATLHAVLAETARHDSGELSLVDARTHFAAPRVWFSARRVA